MGFLLESRNQLACCVLLLWNKQIQHKIKKMPIQNEENKAMCDAYIWWFRVQDTQGFHRNCNSSLEPLSKIFKIIHIRRYLNIKIGLNKIPDLLLLANPKSDNLILPSSSIRIFSGLRSLYIIFSVSWRYSRAKTT